MSSRVASLASGVAASLTMLACSFGGAPPEAAAPPVAVAERGAFRVVVEETGVLRAKTGDRLRAQSWGMVATVLDEGATVRPGDVVVSLDTTELESELRRLKSEMAEARAGVDKHLAELAFQQKSQALDVATSEAALLFAQRKLASARQALDDSDRQLASGLISHAARDRKELDWQAADHAALLAQIGHERKREDIATERRNIELERQRATQSLADLESRQRYYQAQIDRSSLRASIAGRVFFTKRRWRGSPEERKLRVGDDIGPWAGSVAEVPDLASLEVRSQVDESLIGRVQPGTVIEAEIGAVEGLRLTGRVDRVDPIALGRSRSEGGGFAGAEPAPGEVEQVVFPLTIVLDGTDERLQPGMTVGVRFVLDELKDVVSVPQQAVFGSGGEALAFVRTERGSERRAVHVGPVSAGRVVVTEGLAEGEAVFLADPGDGDDDA